MADKAPQRRRHRVTAFEPDPDQRREEDSPVSKSAQVVQREVTKSDRRIRQRSKTMTILIAGSRQRQPRAIPFMRKLEKSNRVLDGTAKKEWVDDAERRLRDVVSRVDPRPMLLGYHVERLDDGLILSTITSNEIGKREIAFLSTGEWPCWIEIVDAVPELDRTAVVFDAAVQFEWSRQWDMLEQERRIQAEYGIYS